MKTILILMCVAMTGCVFGNTLGSLQTAPGARADNTLLVHQQYSLSHQQTVQPEKVFTTSAPAVQRERLDNGRCNPYLPFDDFIRCDLEQAKVDAAKERASNE